MYCKNIQRQKLNLCQNSSSANKIIEEVELENDILKQQNKELLEKIDQLEKERIDIKSKFKEEKFELTLELLLLKDKLKIKEEYHLEMIDVLKQIINMKDTA